MWCWVIPPFWFLLFYLCKSSLHTILNHLSFFHLYIQGSSMHLKAVISYLTQLGTIRLCRWIIANTFHWRFRWAIKISQLSMSCPATNSRKPTINNNNNNNPWQCLWCCRMTQVISRVHLVHLMNVEQRQVATDPQTNWLGLWVHLYAAIVYIHHCH